MKAVNIQWDTDGDEEVLSELPTEIEIPKELIKDVDPDDYCDKISDFISNQTGFCHFGFDLEN